MMSGANRLQVDPYFVSIFSSAAKTSACSASNWPQGAGGPQLGQICSTQSGFRGHRERNERRIGMFKNILRRLDIDLHIEIELVFPIREPESDRINITSHEKEVCFFQDSRELLGE